MAALPDRDPQETQEWLEALDGVLKYEGPERAHFLLEQLTERARRGGVALPYSANTPYVNTIPPGLEEKSPGDHELEHRIRSYVRWNAAAMVVRANKNTNVGGHIASFASAATLYDVGFNHFWHAPSPTHGGDLVFAQAVLGGEQRGELALQAEQVAVGAAHRRQRRFARLGERAERVLVVVQQYRVGSIHAGHARRQLLGPGLATGTQQGRQSGGGQAAGRQAEEVAAAEGQGHGIGRREGHGTLRPHAAGRQPPGKIGA